jgi:propionyl-CoA synthetase
MDDAYELAHGASLRTPVAFWSREGAALDWFAPCDEVAPPVPGGRPAWFTGGAVNACHESLDRHVAAGHGDRPALVYESALRGVVERFSYAELRREVAQLAGCMASRGVATGDTVLVYMPAIPQALMAMLACARLGAVHAVVFGGFGARELAARIALARPKLVLAASCGLEPGRVVPYLPTLHEALALAPGVAPRILVWQRPECVANLREGHDEVWQDVVPGSPEAECRPVAAEHPLYVLYTSGTTGQPKGVLRDTAGYLVALRYSMRAVYGVDAGDVYWAASDVGWVVGHSYMVYGPLLAGCTTVMYEGKPVGTPDAGAYWRMIDRHGVNVLFTAPTAIRAIKRDDPEGRLIADAELRSLRAVFLAGERSDPDTVHWLERRLARPVIDHWWQTETGWPVTGLCLGLGPRPARVGSAGLPVPGYEVRALDPDGAPLPAGETGALAIRWPLPPGCATSLWGEPDGFRRAYLDRFPGWYATGDGGHVDADGYVHVMGRIDDVINVAGHRLSTGEIEEVIAAHPAVAECAVIAVPDTIKGHVPLALVTLKAGTTLPPAEASREIIACVRHDVGAVASLRTCVVVSRLPKTRSGKVLRATMRKIAAHEPWSPPPTIEDPDVLGEIARAFEAIDGSVDGSARRND